MSENALWQTMRQQMGAGKHWLEATRHEESLQAGVADLSYVSKGGHHGWIELKKLKAYPVRESTIVRIDHYTNAQRIFLKRKGRRGGFTWLFLQIGRDYFVFDWLAAQGVGTVNREGLKELAQGYWEGGCDWAALGDVLDAGENA